VAEVLVWARQPLAAAEVAAVMDTSREQADEELALVAAEATATGRSSPGSPARPAGRRQGLTLSTLDARSRVAGA
jgi:hypothetical protein